MNQKLRHWIRGMGSTLELAPTGTHISVGRRIIARSDFQALQSDWNRIGDDFRVAIAAERNKSVVADAGVGTSE